VELERSEFSKWAKAGKTIEESKKNRVSPTSSVSAICFVSVPNVWIDADLLRGGGAYDRLVNLGGTLGSFWGTDLFTSGSRKVENASTISELMSAVYRNKGDLWGMTVYGHGSPDGWLVNGAQTEGIRQMSVQLAVKSNGYKIAYLNMMQCYSKATIVRPLPYPPRTVDFEKEWKKVAMRFHGYFGVNFLGFDLGEKK
ncbi:MAG: hypothetical protein IJ678_03085, partial [Kiritimatiellae bacterium]|nr:hypothetical protein [Kiritimatiellia bacterium]